MDTVNVADFDDEKVVCNDKVSFVGITMIA